MSWPSRDLYPFEWHTVVLDGCSVHYLDEGSGPPLLLLHGNPTWSFLYREIVPALSGRFRCVAPDYPGFGLSKARPGYGFTFAEHARVVEQLVLRLDLRETTMMVHDWGGPIGFRVATRHPERFAGFVIGNSWAWPIADPVVWLFARLLGGRLGDSLILRRNAFVETILPLAVRTTTLSPAAMEAYRGPFPTPAARRAQQVLVRELLAAAPALDELERSLGALRQRPALIVWAGRDPAFRRAQRRRWQAHFPRHALIALPDAGHYLQEEAPARISRAILDWHAATADGPGSIA